MLELRNESTSLYKTFESTITSKFVLFKSDAMVENRKIIDNTVEKIAREIQRSKEDITKSSKENADDLFTKIDKKTNLIIF